jgi:hypothetical protein
MNFRSAFEKVNDEVRNFSPDDILHALGLEKKRSATEKMLPMIGIFGAGLLVGAGIALLLSPKSGREIREAIGGTVSRYTSKETSEGGEARPGYGTSAGSSTGTSAPNGRVNI